MEKLFITYKSKRKMTVDCKKNGTAKDYFEGLPKIGIQDAYIQRYPKQKNPAVILVREGVYMNE